MHPLCINILIMMSCTCLEPSPLFYLLHCLYMFGTLPTVVPITLLVHVWNPPHCSTCYTACTCLEPSPLFYLLHCLYMFGTLPTVLPVTLLVLMHVKHAILYHNCMYSRLTGDEPSGSKRVEDIKKFEIKILIYKRFILLVCVV
jgi:hypothetical protein